MGDSIESMAHKQFSGLQVKTLTLTPYKQSGSHCFRRIHLSQPSGRGATRLLGHDDDDDVAVLSVCVCL